eukprot:TRINITY_DN1082_c1_g2_i1.p1 TRINITY_DN1082_c1_g2~~TRINITY_DN1082_c1_g2_i1.p1  ORF type:complete len:430 (-),score=82.77 TRINITY_DN1082_c1_g2_i1:90-1379(-)
MVFRSRRLESALAAALLAASAPSAESRIMYQAAIANYNTPMGLHLVERMTIAPNCSGYFSHNCSDGEEVVQRPDTEYVTFGCHEAGREFEMLENEELREYEEENPNDPLQHDALRWDDFSLDKCCVEKNLCYQTCGVPVTECHKMYYSCVRKLCSSFRSKKWSECHYSGVVADTKGCPYQPQGVHISDKTIFEKRTTAKQERTQRCSSYRKAQQANCMCVPKDTVNSIYEERLIAFYRRYNPEKLDWKGAIKDADEVWKKWRGREPQLLNALNAKYKTQVVNRFDRYLFGTIKDITEKDQDEIDKARERIETDEETEPNERKKKEPSKKWGDVLGSQSEDAGKQKEAEEVEEEEHYRDAESVTYLKAAKKLKQEIEDTPPAFNGEKKAQLEELKKKEAQRLKELKNKASEEEDYMTAKNINSHMKKHEL